MPFLCLLFSLSDVLTRRRFTNSISLFFDVTPVSSDRKGLYFIHRPRLSLLCFIYEHIQIIYEHIQTICNSHLLCGPNEFLPQEASLSG